MFRSLSLLYLASFALQAADLSVSIRPVSLEQTQMKRALSPHQLVEGDFDHDGISDVIVGDVSGGLFWFRGALPRTGVDQTAFAQGVLVGEIGFSPDWMVRGDFDNDGFRDLVVAETDRAELVVLRGRGDGRFHQAFTIPLGGAVTALATGEIDRYDGLPGLVVATNEPALYIFNDPRGALTGPASVSPLDGLAQHVTLGRFDDDFYDIAVAGGQNLWFIPGSLQSFDSERAHSIQAVHHLKLDAPVAAMMNRSLDGSPGLGVLLRDGVLQRIRFESERVKHESPLIAEPMTQIALQEDDVDLLVANHLSAADVIVRQGSELTVLEAGRDEHRLGRSQLKTALGRAMIAMRVDATPGSELVMLTDQPHQPLMVVELRGTLNTWTVTSTDNTNDGICDAHCTLLEAVSAANASFNDDIISFAGLSPGDVLTDMGVLTLDDAITFDGTTHPDGRLDFQGTLRVEADNVTLRNITFLGQIADAVVIFGVANTIVEGCYFGVTSDGASVTTPVLEGRLSVNAATNTLIGGTTEAARNLFGNTVTALDILNHSSDTQVYNNYFKLAANGVDGLPGELTPDLILIRSGAANTVIGGPDPNQRNIFYLSSNYGIRSNTAGAGPSIQGNYFGLNADGEGGGELATAIRTDFADVLIGGEATGAGNQFESLSIAAIRVTNNAAPTPGETVILGNLLGTNTAGDFFGVTTGMAIAGTELPVIGSPTANNRLIGTGTAAESRGIQIDGPADYTQNFFFNFRDPLVSGALGKPTLVATAEQNGDLWVTYNGAELIPGVEYAYPLTVFFYVGVDDQGQAILGSDTYTELEFIAGDKTVNLGPIANLPLQFGTPITALARDVNAFCSNFADSINAPFPIDQDLTYTVNAMDGFDGVCDTEHCSLREAIFLAKQNGGVSRIHFNMQGPGPFVFQEVLGQHGGTLIVDGATQPGYAGTPLIEFNGVEGLTLAGARDSLIRGVAFTGHETQAVHVIQGVRNRIVDSYFGVGADGVADGNGTGLVLERTFDAEIDHNVFSGNTGHGVASVDDSTGVIFTNNLVGASPDGMMVMGNGQTGVELMGTGHRVGGVGQGNVFVGNQTGLILGGGVAQGNTIGVLGATRGGSQAVGVVAHAGAQIGGLQPGEENLISGNDTMGLELSGVALGNLIGTDATGQTAVPNGVGVVIMGAGQLGDGTVEGRNIVAGNDGSGVRATGDGYDIHHNWIGVDVDGDALPNGGLENVRLDGMGQFRQNLSAESLGIGVALVSGPATLTGNIIRNNQTGVIGFGEGHVIGLPEDGNHIIDNLGRGVVAELLVGADMTIEANTITGNGGSGIQTDAANTEIRGNLIDGNGNAGVVAGGDENLIIAIDGLIIDDNIVTGNIAQGVRLEKVDGAMLRANRIGLDALDVLRANNGDGILVDGSTNVVIGGVTTQANIISGNGGHGVLLTDADVITISGNIIGLDGSGAEPRGNAESGVAVTGASNTTIGGVNSSFANTISGNQRNGVETDTRTTIRHNRIGPDITGDAGAGNLQAGLLLTGNNHDIDQNTIAGNQFAGVLLRGSLNSITGNRIGLAANGISALGNGGDGILIDVDVSENVIGTVFGGQGGGNTIAYNGGDGVRQTAGSRNRYSQNAIFANNGLAIDIGGDGVTPNDVGDTDFGPNGFLNFPTVTQVTSDRFQTVVMGTIDADATENYFVEIYVSTECDPSGFGEGATYLGTVQVATDFFGQADWELVVPTAVVTGNVFSALATTLDDDTSEMGACFDSVIFSDDFESGDLSAWSAITRGAAEGLEVRNDAAFNGVFGLQVTAGSGAAVKDDTPDDLIRYHARVYVLTNPTGLGSGVAFPFLGGQDVSDLSIFQIGIVESSGEQRLFARVGGVSVTGPVMPEGWNPVEVQWDASINTLSVLLNDVEVITLSDPAAGGATVESVTLGDLDGVGEGTLNFDDFVSTERQFIGSIPCPTSAELLQSLPNWPTISILELVDQVNRACPVR